mmetsp:Transcript_79323/g.244748  ORF Transcript_79323/g.244748 Transcript_79323/m.244748 type:complete len:203 (-) Transcript_79323:31-639(-)
MGKLSMNLPISFLAPARTPSNLSALMRTSCSILVFASKSGTLSLRWSTFVVCGCVVASKPSVSMGASAAGIGASSRSGGAGGARTRSCSSIHILVMGTACSGGPTLEGRLESTWGALLGSLETSSLAEPSEASLAYASTAFESSPLWSTSRSPLTESFRLLFRTVIFSSRLPSVSLMNFRRSTMSFTVAVLLPRSDSTISMN